MNHDPLFFPAVALLGRDQAAGTAVGEVGLHLFVDVGDDRLRELLLVPFQRQHEVGTARDDIQGDGRLSPHRDDRSPDIGQLQQRGNGWISLDFSSVANAGRTQPNHHVFLSNSGLKSL